MAIVLRDVPLGRRLRVLAVANLAAVDVKVHAAAGSTNLGYRAASPPMAGKREAAHIDTRRVVVARSPRRVAAELVAHVDIDGDTECSAIRSLRSRSALQFDVAGYRDAVPPRGREGGLLWRVEDAERPPPVEAQAPRPLGHHAVVWLHLVQPVHLQVVPIGLRLHAHDAEKRHYYANGEIVLAHIWVQRYEKKEIAEPFWFRYHTN